MVRIETQLAQAIGEISQANKQMATSLESINANLKTLNDNNILHASRTEDQHVGIIKQLDTLTAKYWWLILVLLAVVLFVLGYKEVTKFLP